MALIDSESVVVAPFKHAILFALQPDRSPLGAITERIPSYLLPLAGKSLADRIAGSLSDLGVEQLTVFVLNHAQRAAEFFGDGTRWGINVQLIDLRSEAQAVSRLKQLQPEGGVLVGTLSCWPNIDRDLLGNMAMKGDVVFVDESEKATGWGAVQKTTVEALDADELTSFWEQIAKKAQVQALDSELFLKCDNAVDIITSTQTLLMKKLPNQLISGASGDPGLWIGAGSSIHPTVQIDSPVWIGENCRLGRGVRLGANTCIADNCVIGELASLENTCVLSGTCIGNQVDLKDVIVDRNYLAYIDAEEAVAIPDSFLIAPNQPLPVAGQLMRLFGRLVALLLLGISSPFFLFVFIGGKLLKVHPVVNRIECIRLPAETDSVLWKKLGIHQWNSGKNRLWNFMVNLRLIRLLPALFDIGFGHLHWVGLKPRREDEVQALRRDWKMLYLNARVGFFQLFEIDRNRLGDSSDDQEYSSEAFYAATHNMKLDLRIILQSLFLRRSRVNPEPSTAILSSFSGPDMLDQLHGFLNENLSSDEVQFSKSRVHEIVTAVHEACTNVLRHAYGNETGRPIQLHVRSEADCFVAELYDQGPAFTPEEIPTPDFTIDAEGGFGWYLIQELASSIDLSRTGNGWNQLTLRFNYNPIGEEQNGC